MLLIVGSKLREPANFDFKFWKTWNYAYILKFNISGHAVNLLDNYFFVGPKQSTRHSHNNSDRSEYGDKPYIKDVVVCLSKIDDISSPFLQSCSWHMFGS